MDSLASLTTTLAARYAIAREIGAGGMATVYLARDLRHDRQVALKVLKPELGAVLGGERFLAEIRVTANLQHPNLLPLFDSGEAGGLLYYVMPFVEGESLRARLDREKQLPIDEAVRIAVALAGALAYAHDHGVIHRDLKPENILLQAGHPVIADFGIALAISNAGGARVTQTGLSLGTPQYMSPEQATGDRTIDRRADIYALGAVTYEMLAGEPPHSGPSAQAIIAKLMTTAPQPLRVLRPTVPVHVAQAVEQALAKLPADRFRTAEEFAAALRNPTFTSSALTTPGATHATRRWNRSTLLSSGIAALLFVVVAWLLTRPAPAKPVIRYTIGLDTGEALGGPPWGRMALSQDGSWLVYIGLQGRLLLRSRDQLHAIALAQTEGATNPFFSPNGEQVGFLVNVRTLKVVSLRGGPPVLITDSLVGGGGASWGPDGFIYSGGIGATPLVRVEAKPGAVPRWFTTLNKTAGEIDHTWPDVLPNGKGVLFTVTFLSAQRSAQAIAVADLATGTHRILTNGVFARYAASGHLLYVTEDGTLMVAPFDQETMKLTGEATAAASGLRLGTFGSPDLAVSRTGTLVYGTGNLATQRELVWVTRDGKTTPVDPAWHEPFRDPALSPDGTRLAVTLGVSPSGDVWIKQLDRGPALKLTQGGKPNGYPTWTPDGQSVTYYSDATGPRDLYTKRADGSARAVPQLHRDTPMAEAVWSHDGRWLIYRPDAQSAGSGDIFALRPGVDTVPIPLAATRFTEFVPALSPDDRWLAYSSNESGRLDVYVVPFPNASAAKWPVSTHGGSEPLWSHSGRELFYRDSADNLVSVAVKSTPTFSAGPATVLFPAAGFAAYAAHRQYDIAPDDRRFLMLRPLGANAAERLVVVDNWFEELKRKR